MLITSALIASVFLFHDKHQREASAAAFAAQHVVHQPAFLPPGFAGYPPHGGPYTVGGSERRLSSPPSTSVPVPVHNPGPPRSPSPQFGKEKGKNSRSPPSQTGPNPTVHNPNGRIDGPAPGPRLPVFSNGRPELPPPRWYAGVTSLGVAEDKYYLSELQCVLRSEFVEAFGTMQVSCFCGGLPCTM